jgi:hypothetical protein
MTTEHPDDGCIVHLTYVSAAIEDWLRRTTDGTSQGHDRALSGILADLFLHLERLSDEDVDTTVASLQAEERILRVLEWLDIAPNDVHGAFHLAMACALSAHEADAVRTRAWLTWQAHRSGTDTSITASMFEVPCP